MKNKKNAKTLSDYMKDKKKVSAVDRERINFEIDLAEKMVKGREERGLSQRRLADITGLKQPTIARLESMRSDPQLDTLFNALYPLGYTLEIVPLLGGGGRGVPLNKKTGES